MGSSDGKGVLGNIMGGQDSGRKGGNHHAWTTPSRDSRLCRREEKSGPRSGTRAGVD